VCASLAASTILLGLSADECLEFFSPDRGVQVLYFEHSLMNLKFACNLAMGLTFGLATKVSHPGICLKSK
jgi:hypothetical protein